MNLAAARRARHGNVSVAALLVLTGIAGGFLLASVGGDETPRLTALALIVAGSLLVHIPVPWGGSVPIGYALLIALPSIEPLDEVTVVVTGALLLVSGVTIARDGAWEAIDPLTRIGLCAVAAGIGGVSARILFDDALAVAAAAALVLVAVELAATRRITVDGATVDVRSVLPVLSTVACGAALIAVARAEVGWEMTIVAAFPLLITRFAFRRSAEAEETLRQTVQALGLVPELAGLAPLGHSERSAIYARRMARLLGCTRSAEERIVTACRLQYLGAVPRNAQPGGSVTTAEASHDLTPTEIAVHGAHVLAEAGFPEEVVGLVRRARAGSMSAAAQDLEAAIVRVATAFDQRVGEDATTTSQALGSVTAAAGDAHTRLAAAALVQLSATEPGLVREAITAGATFREAASGLDLEPKARATGALLPFVRRRA